MAPKSCQIVKFSFSIFNKLLNNGVCSILYVLMLEYGKKYITIGVEVYGIK